MDGNATAKCKCLKKMIGGAEFSCWTGDLGLLIIRVFAGISMAFAHGWGKIPPSEGFLTGVEAMGFPAPVLFAWLAGLSEFVGGLLLAVGLLTRPAALAIAGTMFVAGVIRHADDPFKIKELAFVYLALSIGFVLTGGGKYSLDHWLRKKFCR